MEDLALKKNKLSMDITNAKGEPFNYEVLSETEVGITISRVFVKKNVVLKKGWQVKYVIANDTITVFWRVC